MLNLSVRHVGSVHREICPAVALKSAFHWTLAHTAASHPPDSTSWQKQISSLHLSEETDHISPFTVNALLPVCALVHVGRPVRNSLKSTSIGSSLLCCCNASFWTDPFSLSSLTFDWLPTICCKNTQPNLLEWAFKKNKKLLVLSYCCCSFCCYVLWGGASNDWHVNRQQVPCRQLFSWVRRNSEEIPLPFQRVAWQLLELNRRAECLWKIICGVPTIYRFLSDILLSWLEPLCQKR